MSGRNAVRAAASRLARPARAITLGEVVRDLEDDQPLVECFRADGGNCVLTPRCRLKKKLAAAREAFLKELDATSLAECAYPSHLIQIAPLAGAGPMA